MSTSDTGCRTCDLVVRRTADETPPWDRIMSSEHRSSGIFGLRDVAADSEVPEQRMSDVARAMRRLVDRDSEGRC